MRNIHLYSVLPIGLLMTSPVLAQDSTGVASSTGVVIDEILVTARRTEEKLQQVPIAITAFNQDALNERSITSSYDLARSVPGLVVNAGSGNASLPDFSIRGRGQFFGAASGSVETYFADVPLSPPFQIPTLPPQYFDLASVQVLKGPQGTLFGRNTTGGAVLFVPAPPTDKLEGYARGQLGDYQNRQFEAALNLPLSEKVALRLAGFYWHREGYTKTLGGELDLTTFTPLPVQDYNNQDVIELRGTLRVDLSDTLTNSTIVTWHGDKNRSSSKVIKGRSGTAFGAGVTPSIIDDAQRSTLDTNLDRDRSSTFAIINTTTWDISENLRVKNILSYISARGYGNNPSDVDGAAIPGINLVRPLRQLKNRQLVNELQLQGTSAGGKLDWIIGGMHDQTRQPGGDSTMNIVTNTFSFSEAGPDYDIQFRQSRFTTQSLFASLTYHVTDKLTLTGAARRTWDDIYDRSVQVNNNTSNLSEIPDPDTLPASVAYLDLVGQRKFRGWSYNVGADYKLNDDVMLYAGYKRGYKRGGFNGRGADLANFGPETVDNFYAGAKTNFQLAGQRGTFNIEGFWDIYHGAQRSYLDLSGGALVTTIQNVPKSRYRGFDTDLAFAPTDWLSISANYTFVDARHLKYPDETVATALSLLPEAFRPIFLQSHPISNNALAVNPPGANSKHKVNFQARLHKELETGVELALIPSLSYQSKLYLGDATARVPAIQEVLFNGGAPIDSAADGASQIPGYTLINLRAEANNLFGRDMDLAVGATNLTNKDYILGGGGIWAYGVDAVVYGPPRMFYIEARFRF
ncbi:TonB-dependent receptor [Parapedomonas caeni]